MFEVVASSVSLRVFLPRLVSGAELPDSNDDLIFNIDTCTCSYKL
jgi:hypothetical protein